MTITGDGKTTKDGVDVINSSTLCVIGIEGVMPLAPIFGPKTFLGKGSLWGRYDRWWKVLTRGGQIAQSPKIGEFPTPKFYIFGKPKGSATRLKILWAKVQKQRSCGSRKLKLQASGD